jgi:hypothetical protein
MVLNSGTGSGSSRPTGMAASAIQPTVPFVMRVA